MEEINAFGDAKDISLSTSGEGNGEEIVTAGVGEVHRLAVGGDDAREGNILQRFATHVDVDGDDEKSLAYAVGTGHVEGEDAALHPLALERR